jgi:hypothetical protein
VTDLLKTLVGPFTVPADAVAPRRITIVVEGVRIGFGLVCFHRALDMAGFSILSADPAGYATRALLEASVALAVAAGLLTPLSLVVLLGLLCMRDAGQYLGLQVARMLVLGLLLSGAGRHFSLDALARRRGTWARALNALYVLGPPQPNALAPARLLVLALYWAVAFSGVRYHFFDSFWLRGEVLQLALTMPYFTDHHAAVVAASERFPLAFDVLCRVGLYVQAFWQLALLPLFYVPWKPVRFFVVFQGLAFFLVSTFVLNLGYLGLFELLMWALLFAVAPKLGVDPRVRDATPPEESLPRRLVLFVGLALTALFTAQMVAASVDQVLKTKIASTLQAPRWLLLPLGLGRVNVFNEEDIRLGTVNLVLVETTAEGYPTRVVPFLDKGGGRLDYLRNDYLYFSWSLSWQRLPRSRQIARSQPFEPTDETRKLLQWVARLDACLTGPSSGPRHYLTVVMAKTIVRDGGAPRWSVQRALGDLRLSVDHPSASSRGHDLPGLAGTIGCYDLPPGHFRSGVRGRETLIWVRASRAAPDPARQP